LRLLVAKTQDGGGGVAQSIPLYQSSPTRRLRSRFVDADFDQMRRQEVTETDHWQGGGASFNLYANCITKPSGEQVKNPDVSNGEGIVMMLLNWYCHDEGWGLHYDSRMMSRFSKAEI
jgi:hypothetical protein